MYRLKYRIGNNWFFVPGYGNEEWIKRKESEIKEEHKDVQDFVRVGWGREHENN